MPPVLAGPGIHEHVVIPHPHIDLRPSRPANGLPPADGWQPSPPAGVPLLVEAQQGGLHADPGDVDGVSLPRAIFAGVFQGDLLGIRIQDQRVETIADIVTAVGDVR